MTSTFGPGLAVDPVTLAPVPNTQLRVLDAQGVDEYSTQNLNGEDRLVFTDHRGQYPQFQIAESVPVAILTSPPYMQRIVPLEVLQGASQAITELGSVSGAVSATTLAADRAEAAAVEAAGVVARVALAVDVPAEGLWMVGDDWRGRDMLAPTGADAPVAVDVPTTGVWVVGDDWRGRDLLAPAVDPSAESAVAVDVPTAGDWAIGDDWRGRDRNAVPATVADPATATAAHLSTARALFPDVGTAGASPVVFIWDDYPDATLEHVVPLFAAHGIPWGWALCGGTFTPGHLLAPTEGTRTWADVAALDPAQVELINHGWSHGTVSSVVELDHEIRQSAETLRVRTGQRVLGFTAPSVSMPGINFADTANSRPGQFVGTPAGDAIRREHAWWTSSWKRPGDTPATWTFPRRGWPSYAAGGDWVDAGQGAIDQQKARVDLAIQRGHGLIIRGHAKAFTDGKITAAGLEGLLTHITAHRTAGRVTTLLPTPWMLSDTTA